jgi:activating signal cointegrator complex subunit 3
MKRIHPKGICVYIAPLKSLARERLKEWKLRLGSAPLNWKVLELSGDTHHDQKALNSADVLVCTPEKWDLISRGWKGTEASDSNAANGKAFVKRVRLLVIDEIHLLGEERGAVLEAIVSRTRFISKFVEAERQSKNESVDTAGQEVTRIVGLSTALANAVDLADWIGIDTKGHGPTAMRGLYNFRPSVRPIPMDVHIQGYAGRHYCPRMATMNKPCYAAIKEYSPNNPTLIFVASRRQTRLTAFDLISYAAGDENPRSFLGCSQDLIESIAKTIQDDSLRHTITFGIGLHHAGLSSRDRDTVEKLFLGGEIQVLVATATLAWGVNLPARFVIVKGTEYFDGKQSRYVDYPLTDVLQMIGRAGRPGFDTEGKALVMVEESKKSFYKKFLYLPFPVESCLEERMCENLNAEIAIGTISSVADAVGYLTWTFFARRVAANPSYYGADSGKDEDVQAFLLSVVKETTAKLAEHGCIDVDKTQDEVDSTVLPTTLGRAASDYYLHYRTPKQMLFGVKEARKLVVITCIEESGISTPVASGTTNGTGLKPFVRSRRVDEVSIAWILYALSSTHEFDELPVRHNEEHLNATLCEDVMWGADTSALIAEDVKWGEDTSEVSAGGNGSNLRNAAVSLDIMADPHTK